MRMKKEISWKKQTIIFIAIIAAIIIADQLFKYYAVTVIKELPRGRGEFIPGFMIFNYTENTGAAMSMFSGATWILACISGVMAVVVLYLLFKHKEITSWLYKLSLCFVAGGAIGNLLDRVFRGYVVDFLEFDFVRLAIFNVADIFICTGAVMLAVYVIMAWEKDRKNKGSHANEEE